MNSCFDQFIVSHLMIPFWSYNTFFICAKNCLTNIIYSNKKPYTLDKEVQLQGVIDTIFTIELNNWAKRLLLTQDEYNRWMKFHLNIPNKICHFFYYDISNRWKTTNLATGSGTYVRLSICHFMFLGFMGPNKGKGSLNESKHTMHLRPHIPFKQLYF